MSLFIWKDSLDLGVDFLDREHQDLADAVNALFEVMARNEPYSVVAPLLTSLVQKTEAHFVSEEAAFTGYPATEAHRARHKELLAQLRQLQADSAEGKVQLALRAMQYLHRWLVEHIETADRDLVRYLKARG